MEKEIHYTEVDKSQWPWKNFTPEEMASKSDGLLMVHRPSMDKLQRFRNLADEPVIVNSAYRSEAHNKKVGGKPNSYHRKGMAFDIPITKTLTRQRIHFLAKTAGFTGFGDYDTFVHIDTGPVRYWDERKGK